MAETPKIFSPEEIEEGLKGLGEEWMVESDKVLSKVFEFDNFKEALKFVNKVGEIAESANHHPDIHIFDYKKVSIELTTHDADGITEKDFEVAAEIESVAQ